jgi:aldehyde:ferredoxin oxidoreductase
MAKLGGYMGKMLRVDLTKELITEEKVDPAILRKFVGNSGLAVRFMYDEVPPDIEWNDPRNRIIWLTGPFTGSKAPGSGTYCVTTKSPLTTRFGVSHANGFFGARMKFAGFDGVIFQGAAKRWVYLYLHDGVAELRDATHLLGKDTWETEEMLKKEIGQPQVSVSCIGPAGENLVKYACICSDSGHVASSNGVGAVAGSKKIKAIVAHGKGVVPIHDKERFTAAVKDWHEQNKTTLWGSMIPSMGTNAQYGASSAMGFLAIRNLTSSSFPEADKFNGDQLRAYYQGSKPHPCYSCRFTHCHEIELKSGPHKGVHVEEAEWEPLEAFTSMILNTDMDAAMWLNNVNDRLGMDAKEQAFVIGLAMECYEKGLITKKDTGGVELTWGNVQAVETLLHKIARREGFGDVLAEGVMRAAQKIGGDAPKFAVYNKKGHAPHVQDHRGMWAMQFGLTITDLGAGVAGDMGDMGDLEGALGAAFMDPAMAFSPEMVPKISSQMGRRGGFVDCLGVCMFVSGVQLKTLAEALSAITGFDYGWLECLHVGDRVTTMMRALNIKYGQTREHDWMSPREYEATTEGPAQGISAAPVWDKMLDIYYASMGWDKEGKPLPETLKNLGLEDVGKDLGIIK